MIYALEHRGEFDKWQIVALPKAPDQNNELAMRSVAMRLAADDAKPSPVTRKPSKRTATEILVQDYRLGLYARNDWVFFSAQEQARHTPQPAKQRRKKEPDIAP